MKADIITIGDEILIGQIVDTNSAWISTKLNLAGISVRQMISIADDAEQITMQLSRSMQFSDIIILTGGLGPTNDDITKKTLASFFGMKLVLNESVKTSLENLIKKRGYKINELTQTQAIVPEFCTILTNNNGTAPGMWFEKDGKIIVSLPGVPFEMKGLIEDEVLPKLKNRFITPEIYHKTVHTFGVPESQLAIRISNWEKSLPHNIKLAYLPQPGIVRLRLSATGEEKQHLINEVNNEIENLQKIIPEAIFGFDDETLEEVTGKILKSKKLTIAVAESCTGGTISHLLTSISGCSEYFKGSVVAYSNEIKEKVLGVRSESLIQFGAVSKQVVEEMATGVKNKFNTDVSISTSGIAGPSGATSEKPVGTTWIAVSIENEVFSQNFFFGDNRERNIRRASLTALNYLRIKLLHF